MFIEGGNVFKGFGGCNISRHNRGNMFIEGGNVFIGCDDCITSRHGRGNVFIGYLFFDVWQGQIFL